MYDYSSLSAKSGLSSHRCICGIMLDGPSNAAETNVGSRRGFRMPCAIYCWPAVEAAEFQQRRRHGNVINGHYCTDAIIPLLSP